MPFDNNYNENSTSVLPDKVLKFLTGKTLIVGNSQDSQGVGSALQVPQQTENNQTNQEAKGREYLFSKYPNEFEFYACAFELLDSKNDTEDFFSFPVMPNSISNTYSFLNTIKKTSTGIISTINPTFAPTNIKLSGNFGRKFKRLNTDTLVGGEKYKRNVFHKEENQVPDTNLNEYVGGGDANVFDTDFKTGYGCTQYLKRMLIKAYKSDALFGVRKLYFYNLSCNEAFLVEVENMQFFMSQELNGMWQYDITLKSIGLAESFNKNIIANRNRLIKTSNIIQQNSKITKNVDNAITKKSDFQKGIEKNTKLQKLLNTEIGKKVFQVASSYQPNILRTAFQLAENPNSGKYFFSSTGNNIINTGRIF